MRSDSIQQLVFTSDVLQSMSDFNVIGLCPLHNDPTTSTSFFVFYNRQLGRVDLVFLENHNMTKLIEKLFGH